jgi:hypothetical protein
VELSGEFEQSCCTNLGALKHLKHISLGLANCSITEQELKSLAELGEVSALDLSLTSSTVIFMFGTNSICYQRPKAGYET